MSLLLLFRRRGDQLVGQPDRIRRGRRERLLAEEKRKKRKKILLSKEASRKLAQIKKSFKQLIDYDVSIPSVAHDLGLIDRLLNPSSTNETNPIVEAVPTSPIVDDINSLIEELNRDMEDALILIILADE